MVKVYRNIAKLKDIDMFYLDTKTEGIPLVCIHGLYGRAETWHDFMNNYGSKYRIIAPELRGHGFSSKTEEGYTYENMAEDIKELLDYLKFDSIILVGHSVGGAVAAHLASLYPERIKALAILDKSASEPDINTIIDPFTDDWPLPFKTLREAQEFIKEKTESSLEYKYFMMSLIENEEGYDMIFSRKAIAKLRYYRHDWYEVLDKIRCLTMLVRSSSHKQINDKDFEKMKRSIQKCISYEMSNPDHNVHLANKAEFYKYLDEFLKRI